jgi:hypothetical protein
VLQVPLKEAAGLSIIKTMRTLSGLLVPLASPDQPANRKLEVELAVKVTVEFAA